MLPTKIVRKLSLRCVLEVFLFVPLLFLSVNLAFGQAGGNTSITGVVTDRSGGVVPNVSLTVRTTQTGFSTRTTTTGNGTYVIPQLPLGSYTVTFSLHGFKTLTRTGIVLTAAEEATVNSTLMVGNVVQNVQVSANVEMIKRGTAALGTLISQKAVEELPLNGPKPATLVFLSPGG